MTPEDIKLLEIRHEDGSFATWNAARIVLDAAKEGWFDEDDE